jgi:hypothetical protein
MTFFNKHPHFLLSSKSNKPFNLLHAASHSTHHEIPQSHPSHSQMGLPQTQPQFNPSRRRHTGQSNHNHPSDTARTGFGLIHLQNHPNDQTHKQSHDKFATDVEKVYRILKKFHSRVPKLELASLESGVAMHSGLAEHVFNRCGDAGNLGYPFFVWASKQPEYRHSFEVYKTMIKIL